MAGGSGVGNPSGTEFFLSEYDESYFGNNFGFGAQYRVVTVQGTPIPQYGERGDNEAEFVYVVRLSPTGLKRLRRVAVTFGTDTTPLSVTLSVYTPESGTTAVYTDTQTITTNPLVFDCDVISRKVILHFSVVPQFTWEDVSTYWGPSKRYDWKTCKITGLWVDIYDINEDISYDGIEVILETI